MGKKIEVANEKIEKVKEYLLDEAISKVKELSHTKFDETLDLAFNLGVDPIKSDQMVRGTVVLPHGTGKTLRVLVLAKGEKEKEARDAGADFVGAEDMVEKITKGWLDFDKVVATPDIMGRGMRAIIQQGMDQGLFARGNPKMMEFAIMGAVNWISKWFDPAGPLSSQQIGEAFADYLVGQARVSGVRA